MKISQRSISIRIMFLLLAVLMGVALLAGQKNNAALVSENGQLSCSNAQFDDYIRIMLLTGEMTLSQQPDSGALAQQQKMIDTFAALSLPKDKTIVAAGHTKSGKVYTTTCEHEKCTLYEMAQPQQACLKEHWNDCPYLAMQFKEKKYCFLAPASQ
ncbi:MAG TPA: hypothetical protein VKZ94_07450 [Advenella sp.]|nr:hypothetical protein [Advenella sp.]